MPVAIERVAAEIRKTVDGTGPSGLFFLGSAHLSNEENFLLRKLADHLACANRDVVVDKSRVRKIKRKTDWIEGDDAGRELPRAPATWASRPRKNGYGLDAVLSGKASPEVVIVADADFAAAADDPEKVAALRKARFLAVCARTANALTRAADVVLPAASLAEKEGTFTNVQGRVQRFERAFLPKPPVAGAPGSCFCCSRSRWATATGTGRPPTCSPRSRRRSRPTPTSTRRISRAAAS